MLQSYYRRLCPVDLPYQGRQKYMHTFDLANPVMPVGYEDYEPVVVALIGAAGAHNGMAHMTVDERVVSVGESQRRPGPHVDGCFDPSAMYWGHGGGGWRHTCNNVPVPDRYRSGNSGKFARMPVIVASSVQGCQAFPGDFDATPMSDGDLSHIKDKLLDPHRLAPHRGYLLSADCIHESLPMPATVERTFLRIALPTEFVA